MKNKFWKNFIDGFMSGYNFARPSFSNNTKINLVEYWLTITEYISASYKQIAETNERS